MSEIPEYLQNNPDYYIDGGNQVSKASEISKVSVESILDGFRIVEWRIPSDNWMPGYRLIKNWTEIWYISIRPDNSDELQIYYVKINGWDSAKWYFNNHTNFQWQWYWKKLYIWVAIEAKKIWKTLTSDHLEDIKDNSKYVWNSLVNDGIAEFSDWRFRIINENLP